MENGNVERVAERHTVAMNAMQVASKRYVPKDQKVIIMIYDGAQIIHRDLSYYANDATHDDVKAICRAMVGQII
jgi:hypothetical protein